MTARKVVLEDGTDARASGRLLYLPDDSNKYPGAYSVSGWGKGIAWRVFGAELEAFEDCYGNADWRETGRLVCVMVGDDARHAVDLEDLTELDDDSFCHECGQVGCRHDGRERAQS